MCAELYAQIKAEDWSLVGNGIRITWPNRLWNFDKSYRWNGGSGGAGIGYTAPASAGAALANKKHGRISVAIQGDGKIIRLRFDRTAMAVEHANDGFRQAD